MEQILPPKFDDSKEIDIIYNFHKDTHIMRINSTNPNAFLDEGRKFDFGLIERLDSLELEQYSLQTKALLYPLYSLLYKDLLKILNGGYMQLYYLKKLL
jgi:hypothetical protein